MLSRVPQCRQWSPRKVKGGISRVEATGRIATTQWLRVRHSQRRPAHSRAGVRDHSGQPKACPVGASEVRSSTNSTMSCASSIGRLVSPGSSQHASPRKNLYGATRWWSWRIDRRALHVLMLREARASGTHPHRHPPRFARSDWRSSPTERAIGTFLNGVYRGRQCPDDLRSATPRPEALTLNVLPPRGAPEQVSHLDHPCSKWRPILSSNRWRGPQPRAVVRSYDAVVHHRLNGELPQALKPAGRATDSQPASPTPRGLPPTKHRTPGRTNPCARESAGTPHATPPRKC